MLASHSDIPGRTIATESASGTLTRIAGHSSYWAVVTLVRIGNTNAVDKIFDRASLARMDVPAVDGLVERYLESLRRAVSDIRAGDRDNNFGMLLAGIVPEILSRLCCKCSRAAKDKLIDFLLEVYQSEHRGQFREVRKLTRRLLTAFSLNDRIAIVPTLLRFPILANLNGIEAREYTNPFYFIDPADNPVDEKPTITDEMVDVFFQKTSSDDPGARRWAVRTLGTLHHMELLSPAQSTRFGDVLWSQTDNGGMPSGTDYSQCAFLGFPHPAKINPVALFTKYVRGALFPAQESQTKTSIAIGGGHGVPLCHDIVAAKDIEWSDEDVRSIVSRLVEWWDIDKVHLKRVDVPVPFPSIVDTLIVDTLKERLSQLVVTLAAMIVRHSDSIQDVNTRNALKRVVEEYSEYKLPALAAEMACVSLFPEWRNRILCRVEDAMTSTSDEIVMDSLAAIQVISERAAADTEVVDADKEDLARLLSAAGHMIRWRRNTMLPATIKTVVKRSRHASLDVR